MARIDDYKALITTEEFSLENRLKLLEMLEKDTKTLEGFESEREDLNNKIKASQDEARKLFLKIVDKDGTTENPIIAEKQQTLDEIVRELYEPKGGK